MLLMSGVWCSQRSFDEASFGLIKRSFGLINLWPCRFNSDGGVSPEILWKYNSSVNVPGEIIWT